MGGALFAATQLFFTINILVVEGTSRYPEAELWQTAHVKEGDNLLFLSPNGIKARLIQAFAYVKDVQVTRHWPDKLTLTITEKEPCSYLEQEGQCWVMDTDGTLLEKTTPSNVSHLPHITGVTLLAPKLGEIAAFAEADSNRIAPLYALLQVLCQTQLLADVSLVDVGEPYALSLRYKNRFTVQLGMPENLEEKLAQVTEIEDYLESSRVGIINVASSPARFQPDKPLVEDNAEEQKETP